MDVNDGNKVYTMYLSEAQAKMLRSVLKGLGDPTGIRWSLAEAILYDRMMEAFHGNRLSGMDPDKALAEAIRKTIPQLAHVKVKAGRVTANRGLIVLMEFLPPFDPLDVDFAYRLLGRRLIRQYIRRRHP